MQYRTLEDGDSGLVTRAANESNRQERRDSVWIRYGGGGGGGVTERVVSMPARKTSLLSRTGLPLDKRWTEAKQERTESWPYPHTIWPFRLEKIGKKERGKRKGG